MTAWYAGGVDWTRLRKRFKALREHSGKTQDDVGALVKMTGSAISQFETGASNGRINNLERYCEAIDTELVVDIVPKVDAQLVRRLVDVLPWTTPDTRILLHQAIKTAELLRTTEPEWEVDNEPTTGYGRGHR